MTKREDQAGNDLENLQRRNSSITILDVEIEAAGGLLHTSGRAKMMTPS